MAPGAYEIEETFGSSPTRQPFISPSKKYTPMKDNFPGPDAYNPSRADSIVKPKVINVRIERPTEMYHQPAEYTPGPGEYHKQAIDFGKDVRTHKMVRSASQSPNN